MTQTSDSRPFRALARFSGFTLVSAGGWIVDFAIMGTLVQLGTPVFWANVMAAFCGVTFVYVVAGFGVFEKTRPQSHATLLSFYWLWHACAIAASSALIGWGSTLLVGYMPDTGLRPETFAGLGAKLCMTPLALVGNFLFMRFLLEAKKLRG